MAGWKLRKDKTPAETPGTEADIDTASASDPVFVSAAEEAGENTHGTPFLDTVPGLPDFDSDADSHFNGLEGQDASAPGHAESGGPLTLVDYSSAGEPLPQASDFQEAHAHIYDAPGPADAAIVAMPPPEPAASTETGFEPETNFDLETDFEPLSASSSASSSWLSSDFSAETPTVAPFVLDTAPAPAAPPAAPQIVVHIGRLSAPFDLVKDVTTLGRPDSALSYYPDVEIDMDDAVSRRHCEIVRREGGYYLVDTGSTNGTRLNGETLLPHQEHLLAHGDRIHLGDRTEITFE